MQSAVSQSYTSQSSPKGTVKNKGTSEQDLWGVQDGGMSGKMES